MIYTVEDLYNLCKKEIKKGHAKCPIAISDDEEGNGYHVLLYGFWKPTKQELRSLYIDCEIDNVIILG